MVVYLHDHADEHGADDLAVVYRTRLLKSVHAVSSTNVRRIVCAVIDAGCTVVVPDAPARRMSDAFLAVMRCLEALEIPVETVSAFRLNLDMAQLPALASAPVRDRAMTAGAGSGLPVPAG